MTLPDDCTLHLYCIHMVISTSLICSTNLTAKREHFDHITFDFGSKEIIPKSIWFWFKENTEKNCFLNLPIVCFCNKPKPNSKGSGSTDRHQGNPPLLQRSTSLFTISQSAAKTRPCMFPSSPSPLPPCPWLLSAMNLDMPVMQYVATVNTHCNITVEELSFWTEGSRLQTQKLFWFSVFHRTKWSCKTVFFPPFFVCFWSWIAYRGLVPNQTHKMQ